MEKLCDTGAISQELEEASVTEAFQTSPGKAMASAAEEHPSAGQGITWEPDKALLLLPPTAAWGEPRNDHRPQQSSRPPLSGARSHAVPA